MTKLRFLFPLGLYYHLSVSAFTTPVLAFTTTSVSFATLNSSFELKTIQICPKTSSLTLQAGFEQLPGESTTDFIKRITSESENLLNQQKDGISGGDKSSVDNNDAKESKPVGKYQSIEEWDAERNAKGELSWEEKVQFDGQRFGNQLKQDSILRRHLGTF